MNQEIFYYAALYKFVELSNLKNIKEQLYELCDQNNVLGTILIAKEGLNGTICSNYKNINNFINLLKAKKKFNDIDVKFSKSNSNGFNRLKVKIKNEIVTIGEKDINPNKLVGEYVSAKEWNELLNKKNIVLIDTRNSYETSIGSFPNTVIPNTNSFRNFPEWAKKFSEKVSKDTEIAMFCTGGIRCEKASSYMKKIGYDKVYHLKGGILKYFEETPEKDNKWKGECFVFDKRVSVDKNLEKGNYSQCFACKMPITNDDIINEKYMEGVSCPKCWDKTTSKQKMRFSQRQKQIELSKENKLEHIGQNTPSYKKFLDLNNKN